MIDISALLESRKRIRSVLDDFHLRSSEEKR